MQEEHMFWHPGPNNGRLKILEALHRSWKQMVQNIYWAAVRHDCMVQYACDCKKIALGIMTSDIAKWNNDDGLRQRVQHKHLPVICIISKLAYTSGR